MQLKEAISKYKKVILIGLIWLFIVNIFAIFALNRFNLSIDNYDPFVKIRGFESNQSWGFNNIHYKWDSEWYTDIAKDGYSLTREVGRPSDVLPKLSNVVFLPLYPSLMKAVSSLTLGDFVFAGWLISAISLILGLIYFYKFIKEFYPKLDPYLPIFLMLIFPTAYFFNTVYTESLFLFLSMATIYYSYKEDYLKGGIFGLLAALTRITAPLLLIPIIGKLIEEKKLNLQLIKQKLAPLALIPAGILGFFTYHYLKYGDFLKFFKVEKSFGRDFFIFSETKKAFAATMTITHATIIEYTLQILFVVLALAMTYLIYKKFNKSYGAYVGATALVALSSGTMMSLNRYLLVLFPIYLYVASWKNEDARKIWIFISILLFATTTLAFVNYYWAG
ncbi:MAG: hypothetical protein M1355_02730 [Patescibacteria group bacterium]|nr:hypothetical protein [Patescibacteria group bacterium]